jgi:hypothetical protein
MKRPERQAVIDGKDIGPWDGARIVAKIPQLISQK